jgi:putative two-component system response regulator
MKKILLADSDETNSVIFGLILNEFEYDVKRIPSTAGCPAELASTHYDLLLLGLDANQEDTFGIIESIRQQPQIADTNIVLIIPNTEKIDTSNAYRLGVISFVKRHAVPEVLLENVREAVMVTGKDTILVVDDEPMNLFLFSNLLGIRYNIITAETGREAVDILERENENIDLLLLDLHMPGMDGFEVMRRLSAIPECDNLPIIVVTADTDFDTEAEIFQAGARDYISKPLVMQVAIQRIRRIIELSHLQKSLENEVKKKSKELMLINERLRQLSDQTIFALSSAIDAKDSYTNGHSRRVAQYSREISRRVGKTHEEQLEIYSVALLHDVGKIAIPESIIIKPGKLTSEEFEIIKSHTTRGYEILKTISVMPSLYIGALWHHERYDGLGYPHGKKGDEIPEIARIICVADCYDAMSSDRSYRKALPQAVVRSEIEKGMGKQFDPRFAKIMLDMIDEDKDYKMVGRIGADYTSTDPE